MMHLKSTRWFLLSNLVFGIVLARQGMMGDLTDDELPILKDNGVEREPKKGVINWEDVENGIDMECNLAEETGADLTNGQEKLVKDTAWKWVRLEISDTNEDTEIPLEGQVNSTLGAEGLREAVKGLSGWVRLKCLSGDNFAEFRVDAGRMKAPKLSFRVKKFEKSKNVVEKEDLVVVCDVVNRTLLKPEESIEEGMKRIKEELNVRWYKWSEPEDHSYDLPETDAPTKPNCTRYVLLGIL